MKMIICYRCKPENISRFTMECPLKNCRVARRLCKFIRKHRYLHKAIRADVKNGCNVIRVAEEPANYSVFS
jgi:hypothetical protein